MKYLPLILRNLLRRKTRSLFTLLSIGVAFVLFAVLAAVRLAFGMGVELTGLDRLILIHKVSLIQPLPVSYQARLETMPGVVDVAHASWFGGIYQDRRNFFPQMAVEPERYLRLYPEFVLPEEQKKAWIADRTGAVAGRKLAERFGWKVGDRIPIQGTVWRKRDGDATWEFTLRGIYSGVDRHVDETNFLFQYDYLDEARAFGRGLVGWYTLRIDDPDRAAILAEAIDATFANSRFETRTTTEKAFAQGFANQVGNVGAILTAVLSAVFFTILLVAGNTMAQSVRERINELAVLKTVGFSDGLVLGLILAESLALSTLGGLAGLGFGVLVVRALEGPMSGFLPVFYAPPGSLILGVALALLLGLATGLLPAMRAMRLSIVDALRRV